MKSMYYVKKRMEISASHQLSLDYESKCQNMHGHNWDIVVYLKSKELNANGMVMDFTIIKDKIYGRLDHGNLNELLPEINPTGENIAKWIKDMIGDKCYRVEVTESEKNTAIYEEDME